MFRTTSKDGPVETLIDWKQVRHLRVSVKGGLTYRASIYARGWRSGGGYTPEIERATQKLFPKLASR